MKKFVFSLVCLLITIGTMAQNPNTGKGKKQGENGFRKEQAGKSHKFSPEKYRQRLEGFITKEVGLTTEEQQKFYPLLNEMMEAQRKLMDEEREIMRSGKQAKTEADFEQIVKKTTELQVENRKVEVTYYKKFGKVLKWEQIYKVRMAITKFNMHALRNFSPQKGKQWKKDGYKRKKKD